MNSVFWECVSGSVRSLNGHRTRTLLTAIGIAVAIVSTVLVVSIVYGFSEDIKRQFAGFGAGSVTIQAKNSFEDRLKGHLSYLKYSDIEVISRRVSGISHVTPEVSVLGQYRAPATYLSDSTITDVRGTASSWKDLMGVYPVHGRFLAASDNIERRKVCVVGQTVVENLNLPDNAIGEFIKIGSTWFNIIGVLEERGKNFGVDQDDLILIPYRTGLMLSDLGKDPNFWIQLEVNDLDRMDHVIDRLTAVLRENHGLSEEEELDFQIQNSTQFVEAFNEVTLTITLVIAGITGVSILVGGIGIMNMMLVSVSERTREIGIMKAIGASRSWILSGFLVEAILTSLLGGLIGLIASYFFLFFIGLIPVFPAPVTPSWVLYASLVFSSCIGGVFGVVPAVKAANMEPVEAMRN